MPFSAGRNFCSRLGIALPPSRDFSDQVRIGFTVVEGEGHSTYRRTASLLRRCGKLKGVKPRALLVAQLFLKLGNGDLDRLHRNPGAVGATLGGLQAR